MIGVILTSLALTKALPLQYAALVEWLGVFCIMIGLTSVYSLRKTLPLALTAFLLGIIVDPLVFGGESLQRWFSANAMVLMFAVAGTMVSTFAKKLTTS
jgi:hypothetical protein